jgi:hypothetical protein
LARPVEVEKQFDGRFGRLSRNGRGAVGGGHGPILAARPIDTSGSIWGPTIYPATFRMRA